MRLDNLPIMAEAASAPETTSDAHDDAPSPSDDAPSPNDDPLARTIAKLLDHQVEESHTTDAPDDNTSTEENTPTEGAAAHAAVENTSTTEQDASRVPTDGDGDVDADTNIDATNGSGVEEVAQRRQDADYEGMLLHMSMVFRDDKPTVHEGNGGCCHERTHMSTCIPTYTLVHAPEHMCPSTLSRSLSHRKEYIYTPTCMHTSSHTDFSFTELLGQMSRVKRMTLLVAQMQR